MTIPVRILMIVALLVATTGISHGHEQPHQSNLVKIGFPFPFYLENPQPDEEPLAFASLTDLILGTFSEDTGVNLKTKGEPLYFNYQRIFSAFKIAQERDGGKTFYAELKPNVFFHDGSIATPDDVEFSLNRNLQRSLGANRIKFTKLSPVSFTLSGDSPKDWMRVLGVPLKKRARAVGGQSISAGPYIITEVDRQKRKVRLKAFTKYVNGPPLAPQVEYIFYNNSEMAMFGFLEDETDFICGLTKWQEKLVGNHIGIKIVKYASHDVFMLSFNTAKPPMDDILVRKAISLLIDRHGMIAKSDSLRDGAIATQYQFAMSEPVTKPQADPFAPLEGFKLLEKAGYVKTRKGWEKNGKRIKIFMQLPSHYTSYIFEARLISKYLNDAGLETGFELSSINDFFEPKIKNKYHILLGFVYDKIDFEQNHIYFQPGGRENNFQSKDPNPAILLAGAKSGSLTTSDKEAIIRKVADYSYSAPVFYRMDFCAGKGTEYDDVFFRSPVLFSILTSNAPSSSLRSQTAPAMNNR